MRIILLLGPSSVGKTTLCKELEKNYHWLVLSYDSFACNEVFKKLEAQGLVSYLCQYMDKIEVLQLCQMSRLTISKGKHLVNNHQFPDQTYPNIEEVLKTAGFNDSDIKILSEKMRLAGNIFGTIVKNIDKFVDEIFSKLFDEVFNNKYNPECTIILDVIPPFHNMNKMLAAFSHRVEQYRRKHGESSLAAYTVLAYCQPQDLSNRIMKRNEHADHNNKPMSRREGLFPFSQLGKLLTNRDERSPIQFTLGYVSKSDLLKIAYKHNSIHSKNSAPIKGKVIFKAAANSVLEYIRLSKQFGIWKTPQDQNSLTVNKNLKFDIIINTAVGDAGFLSIKLIEAINNKRSNLILSNL